MGRKLAFSFMMLMLIGTIVGCSGGSYVITVGQIGSSGNQIHGNYRSFNGHYFKEIKLNNGETLIVNLSAKTERGKMIGKVINSDRKTLYILKPGEHVKINQPGKYKLQVEGTKHKGSFTLSWNIQ